MPDAPAPSRTPILVAATAVGGLVLSWALAALVGGAVATVLFLLSQVVVISIVIWQACDPFAEAAQFIGVRLRLPGSVRGATLDAVASSMPELFAGIFFVLVAISSAGTSPEALARVGGDGYGPTVATCAGSAIYNMILIPAICALVISYARKSRPTIDVAPNVILRDGMWFLGCEALLILFLFQTSMHWWMGIVLLGLYAVYLGQLCLDAWSFRRALDHVRSRLGDEAVEASAVEVAELLRGEGMNPSPSLVETVRERLLSIATGRADEEEAPEEAGVLFGRVKVRLDMLSAWMVIATATVVAAAACYWLVEVTREAAVTLQVPVFFVAVILAAAASSVPDTFLSIGAARRGDDDGAVSNAFGSNIFDICVCLSIPLLVSTYLNGWQPISLTSGGEPLPGLVGIRMLLCTLTVVTLLIMWHNLQITRRKALAMCALYGLFVVYAVAGSFGYTFSSLSP